MKTIDSLQESMFKRIRPLIVNYQFKPYQEYDIEQNRLVNYAVDEISSVLSRKENLVSVAEERGKLVGLVSLERLDWDAKHFGVEMAKIGYLISEGGFSKAFDVKSSLLSYLLKICSERQISHLTARVHTEDISSVHALENKSFRVMDTTVTYSFDLRKNQIPELEDQCYVREFRQDDLAKLANIALESFQRGRVATDRFHADPSLPSEKSDELYAKWIVNSCKGLADTVLVAEIDGIPVGYITCKVYRSLSEKLSERFGTMVISAVSSSARRKGIYTSLFNAGLRWLADRVNIVEVGTQVSNYIVQKVWNRVGFEIKGSHHNLVRTNIK